MYRVEYPVTGQETGGKWPEEPLAIRMVYGRLPEWNNQLDQKRPEIRLRIPQVLLIDPGQRSHATQQGKFAAFFMKYEYNTNVLKQ